MKNPLRSRRGTSYLEYFIAAAAIGVATVWAIGNLRSLVGPFDSKFNGQMQAIRGPVR